MTICIEHDFTVLSWVTNQDPNISQRRKLKSLVPETFDRNLLPLQLKESQNWIASIKGVVLYCNVGHQCCYPGVGDHGLWHGHQPPSCRFQCPRLWCELSVFKFSLSFLNLLYVEPWLLNSYRPVVHSAKEQLCTRIRMHFEIPQKTTALMSFRNLKRRRNTYVNKGGN